MSDSIKPIALYRGYVYLVIKQEIEGIVMRATDSEDAKKFYILIGIDSDGERTAGVIINTKNNAESITLSQKQYTDWLKYDSYADCSRLMKVPTHKLHKVIGEISVNDLSAIIQELQNARTIKPIDLKNFGID